MLSSRCVALRSLLPLLAAWLAACASREKSPDGDTWEGVCIDQDQDGFGFQCEKGPDCNDHDPAFHEDCPVCAAGREGCPCEGAEPVDCSLPLELTRTGALLCKTGTRYCRGGKWSGCEGISSFETPRPSQLLTRAVVDQDAGLTICDVCNPDCYRIDDPLEGDAGLGSNLAPSGSGGITLISYEADGGSEEDPLLDDIECNPGVAPDVDCDGIPDEFDAFPGTPPFATDHNTIFMGLAPGTTGEQTFEINFFLNSADIYFYVDMTASMEGERDNLIASLTSGNYLPSSGSGIECADRDFDGTPDNELKNQGIAGNIACLIRDSRLGAGYFRDIPFPGPYANGVTVAPYDFPMFRHYQDITPSVDDVVSALRNFQTRGNYNQPEGSMQGLWAIATGGEVYAGWDRPGIPARRGCPADTWGYPCFRADAVPILIHITDAPLQNGPPTSSGYLSGCLDSSCRRAALNYDSNVLDDLTAGTEGSYRAMTQGATLNDAETVGIIDDVLVTYAGNLDSMGADVSYGDVGSCPSGEEAWSPYDEAGRDAVFRFNVETTKTLTVSTRGSHFDTSLLLMKAGISVHSESVSASGNGTVATAHDLGTLTTGDIKAISGTTASLPASYSRDALGCYDVWGSYSDPNASAISKFQLAQDMTLRFSTTAGYNIGTSLMANATAPATNVDLRTINCGSGASSNCNDNLGDYNVGDLANRFLRFINGDTSISSVAPHFSATSFSNLGCDVSTSSNDVVVDFSLSRATRIRAETSGDNNYMQTSFRHSIALVRRPSSGSPQFLACAEHANYRAVLERDLTAGNYSIILKGRRNSDNGPYQLLLRDVGFAPVPIACHNSRSSSSFTATLPALSGTGTPITYYVVTRGNSSAGSYSLRIEDTEATPFACADDNAQALNDNWQWLSQEEITRTFTPGEYVAIVKGHQLDRTGWFQVSFGDKTRQQSGLFDAKRWLGPAGNGVGGIREALVQRGIRVITVRSSSDSYTNEQSSKLSNETGAVGISGQPLNFGISSDGTGMGYAVIDAVNLLAGNLAMDVGVVLQETPDDPEPDFLFTVEAIDVPGDSCDPPIDTDGDAAGLPDTHVNCRPGATPRFKVTFTNREAPNNVPTNPNDPNGGYHMRLALIGDGTYIVDQIPVYIIPDDVIPSPPTVEYAASGSYQQDIQAAGCVGTEAPLWRSLYWQGTIPTGTRVTWDLCAGNTDQELQSCTYHTAAVVTSSGTCTVDADCDNGYCDGSGLCQFAVGPTCAQNVECGAGGVCVYQAGLGASRCMWTKNPIDLKPAVVHGLQGKSKMRVRATLASNPNRTLAPAIDSWRLDYTCTAQE